MRTGMMGMMVLTAAIVLTIIVSWGLSTDVEEHTVTRYNQLADITGEFQTEKAPEYIDYDPIANYTGYYTAESVVGDTRYFDGVDFISSAPNTYRLVLKPTVNESQTLDLSTVTATGTKNILYWVTNSTTMRSVNYISLADYLAANNLSDLNVTLISDAGSYTSGGFFTFYRSADEFRTAYIKNPDLNGTLVYDEPSIPAALRPKYDASTIADPILYAKYDSSTRSVSMYYDTAGTNAAGIYSPSSVYILWNNDGFFGHIGTQTEYQIPPAEYMDPSKGVSLS